jgi:hypothetical protein
MPSVAKPKNTHAPNDPTAVDGQAMTHGSQEQYYKLMLQDLKIKKATAGLSKAEVAVIDQPSDLDMLTAKILVKLKTFADHDPYLNTLRAITGKEGREDIAEDLAVRHYNKHITDYYVSEVVDSDFTRGVVNGRRDVRNSLGGIIRSGAGNKATGDPFLYGGTTHAGTFTAPAADVLATLRTAAQAIGLGL